tara:strand:- start:70 stop:309 length:240 start_codon:yes stop_codon:yes gene_type:complete
MNGEQENLFDAHLLKTFQVGDLVSWKHLKDQDKEYGFIQEIYSETKGINRKFMFAKVIKTDGSYEPFNLSYLTKESNPK